jgi:hypothetical protein
MRTPRSQLLGVLMRRTMLAAMSSPRTAALPLSVSLFLSLPLPGLLLSQEPAARSADAPHYAFSHVLSTTAALSLSVLLFQTHPYSRPSTSSLFAQLSCNRSHYAIARRVDPRLPPSYTLTLRSLPYLSGLARRIDPWLPPSYTLTLRSFRTYLG